MYFYDTTLSFKALISTLGFKYFQYYVVNLYGPYKLYENKHITVVFSIPVAPYSPWNTVDA